MIKFTPNDLKTWDIVEFRDGELGLVCKESDTIILQHNGSEWIDNYDDELTNIIDCDERFDIMRVYRDFFDNTIDFIDYVEADIVFDRDPSWVNPLKIESERDDEQQKQSEAYFKEMMANCITVLAQGYYGNRTLVTAKKGEVEQTIFGLPSSNSNSDISFIYLSDNVAIVYSEESEKNYLNRIKERKASGYDPKPTCVIPEKNIKLYCSCFLCRIDENGKYANLQDGDIDLVEEYFAW